jgi:hypothetical protein
MDSKCSWPVSGKKQTDALVTHSAAQRLREDRLRAEQELVRHYA